MNTSDMIPAGSGAEAALIVLSRVPEVEEHLQALRDRWEAKKTEAEAMPCTDETVAAVKGMRAELRKEFDAADRQRKAVKARYMAPWDGVEDPLAAGRAQAPEALEQADLRRAELEAPHVAQAEEIVGRHAEDRAEALDRLQIQTALAGFVARDCLLICVQFLREIDLPPAEFLAEFPDPVHFAPPVVLCGNYTTAAIRFQQLRQIGVYYGKPILTEHASGVNVVLAHRNGVFSTVSTEFYTFDGVRPEAGGPLRLFPVRDPPCPAGGSTPPAITSRRHAPPDPVRREARSDLLKRQPAEWRSVSGSPCFSCRQSRPRKL